MIALRTHVYVFLASTALFVVLAPSASARHEAWHNPACKDNAGALLKKRDGTPFDKGIYPPSSPFKSDGSPNSGIFDLSFDPSGAGKVSKVSGGAVLCGTDESQLVFFKEAVVSYPSPSTGAKVNCARPVGSDGKLPKFCNGQNIKDGAYAGSGISDIWCDDENCDRERKNQKDNATANTYVDYNTEGPGELTGRLGDAAKNHCKDAGSGPKKIYAVACFESRNSIDGLNCGSDTVVTVQGKGPYQMKIYQPTCEVQGPARVPIGPSFVDTIRNFQLCDYANPGGSSCGTDQPTTDCSANAKAQPCWLNRNGKGNYKFTLKAVMVKITYLKKGSKEKWRETVLSNSPTAQTTGTWK